MIDPEIILGKITSRIDYEKEKELKNIKDIFSELKPLYKSKFEENQKVVNVELIRGFNKNREVKFIDIFKKAKKEILFMTQPEYLSTDQIDDIAVKFFKKGGIIKSVYEVNDNFKLKTKTGWKQGTIKDLIACVENFEKYGEQIRLCTSKVPNITIFDREIVFMNLNDKTLPKHNEADIITRINNFAESMVTVFESFWDKSLNIKEYKKKFFKNIK
jgi:hypothetical protein